MLTNTLSLFILTILPSIMAEGEAFNPPGSVGMFFFLVALILPIIVGVWVRNRGS